MEILREDGRMRRMVILARWQNCALTGLGRLDRRGHGFRPMEENQDGWPGFVENLSWKVARGNGTRF